MAQGCRSNTLRSVLEGHTLGHLLKQDADSSQIVCFQHTDTVGFVLETFAAQNIISAPVLHRSEATEATASTTERRYTDVLVDDIIGFVDLSVILQHFLRSAFESNVVHHTGDDLEKIGSKFCEALVGTLLEDGTHASCHAASAFDSALKGARNATLLTAIRECFLFCKPGSMRPPKVPSRSIHRVVVHEERQKDKPSRVSGIVSQSDIISFLHRHAPRIGGPMHKAVRELGLVGLSSADVPPSPSSTSSDCSELLSKPSMHPQVITVPHNVTALEAFRRMCMYRVSGVGVLAADGTLNGNLSATDLRSLAPGLFHTLRLPVDQFLAQRPLLKAVQDSVSQAADSGEPDTPSAKRRKTSQVHGVWRLTCQATSTLAEVIALMGCHDVHRIYVVDPDSKPLAAITMSDVLRVVLDNASAPTLPAVAAVTPRLITPPPESVTSGVSDVPASVSTSVQSDGC